MSKRAALRLSCLSIGLALMIFVPALTAQQDTQTPTEEAGSPPDTNSNPNDSAVEEPNQEGEIADASEQPNPAEEAFQRAVQHENENDLDKALEDCNEALRLAPEDLGYLAARAHLYEEMRNPEKAMADSARILERDPTNMFARVLRGRIFERAGDADKALIEFNTAVQQNPTSLDALTERQHYFERQGQSDKAMQDAERMVQLEPDSATGNVARALSGTTDDQRTNFASAAIQQDPENWYAYKLRGLSRAASGDFEGAKSDFAKALELSPNNALVYSARGAMYYMQGDYEKSLADSEQAAHFEPRNCSILALLADRLATCPVAELRDPAKASQLAEKALKLDSTEPLVWRACASAAAANGNFEEAKKWGERVVNSNKLSPDSRGEGQRRLLAYNSGHPFIYRVPHVDEVLAHKKTKQAWEATRDGNFDRAIVILSEVISAKSDYATAFSERGFAYYKKQDFERALADFDNAIRLDPKDADVYDSRAHLLQKIGQYAKAVDDFLTIEKLDPEDKTGVRNNLAWLLATCPDAAIRDGAKAANSINRSLELRPDAGSAWDTRAAVYAENGEFDHAIEWEKKYLGRDDIDEDKRRDGQKRLELYQHHQPFRQDSANAGSNVIASTAPAPTGK